MARKRTICFKRNDACDLRFAKNRLSRLRVRAHVGGEAGEAAREMGVFLKRLELGRSAEGAG